MPRSRRKGWKIALIVVVAVIVLNAIGTIFGVGTDEPVTSVQDGPPTLAEELGFLAVSSG